MTTYQDKELQRRLRHEAASKRARNALREYFPAGASNLDAPPVLAECLELFDLGDRKDAGQLYLEWAVEAYIGRKVEANLDDIRFVYEILKGKGFYIYDYYEYNDMDNRLFYVPHESKKIFCTEGQTTRYVYILEERYGEPYLHIRRYYDEYPFDSEKDEWVRRDEAKFHSDGILAAIEASDWLAKNWSDCLPGNKYPNRPSLQYFKDKNFDLGYHDCRDIGYVLSYDGFTGRADRAIGYYYDIRMAFFDLRCAVGEMFSLVMCKHCGHYPCGCGG